MININLLDSVTEKPKGVAVVEEKVANPQMQTMLMGLVVAGLLVVVIGYDYFSSHAATRRPRGSWKTSSAYRRRWP